MRAANFLGTMPVTRLLGFLVACILAAVTVPVGWALAHEWSESNGASVALQAFEGFRASLVVMEKVSAERGPTNAALGEDLPISAPCAETLARARAESDRQIAHLVAILKDRSCAGDCARESAAIEKMRVDLGTARARVDVLLAKPLHERRSAEISEAIQGMIAIIPEVAPPLDEISLAVREGGPGTLNWVPTTRLLADLREFAGQLGSQFTAALAAQRPLTTKELRGIERIRGRVDQLHALVINRLTVSPRSDAARAALANMERQYFVTGIGYAEHVQALAIRGDATGISPARFAAAYVPPMRSITGLRDVLLDLAEADLHDRRIDARIRLLVAFAVAMLICGVLAAMLLIVRQRMVAPLLDAARMIDAIASGDLNAEVPVVPHSMEVAKLLASIAALNASRIEKMKLENLRDRLMLDMKELSETDSLTGLANRRALERRAKADWRTVNLDEPNYAIVMFDVDRFKQVNDTHGHGAGDLTLRMVAQLCRQTWRQTDIVARVGGDEFVVLMRVSEQEHAVAAAERMRSAIAQTPVSSGHGDPFTVTASFGVACCEAPGTADVEQLFKLADNLLYRAKKSGRNCVIAELAEAPSP
ncbi:diguanylate cyclase [Paraburkholderia madseniana]|uniref:diguanylate cyclase n=1 Tax=Paraburkholderia madseniana TaxID=2599607 RepID=A0A6N6VZ01_9BURK|nr:diguanylate cyclase [Paraburkholderia madseniana]